MSDKANPSGAPISPGDGAPMGNGTGQFGGPFQVVDPYGFGTQVVPLPPSGGGDPFGGK
ncbi:MAG TPA: hypothetical protein VI756_24045 [Blastocatellia bacterium]